MEKEMIDKTEEEKIKLGDIRINTQTGKPEICIERIYEKDGILLRWKGYKEEILDTTLGLCPDSHDLYPLQHFVDVLVIYPPPEEEKEIKIRNAYIASPTNLKEDKYYHETIEFKVLTIEELGTRSIKTTLEELITGSKAVLIRILGRDRGTGRKDRAGKAIYENDIIRWDGDGKYVSERVEAFNHFYEQEPERDCNVIGNIYTSGVGWYNK